MFMGELMPEFFSRDTGVVDELNAAIVTPIALGTSETPVFLGVGRATIGALFLYPYLGFRFYVDIARHYRTNSITFVH